MNPTLFCKIYIVVGKFVHQTEIFHIVEAGDILVSAPTNSKTRLDGLTRLPLFRSTQK